MKCENIPPFLCLILLPSLACAQTPMSVKPTIETTKIQGTPPAVTARIIKYHVDESPPHSNYETGSLHIIYSDKTEVIEKLPHKQKSTKNNIVKNQEGITKLEVAQDKRTIGWAETFDDGNNSDAIP